MIVLLPPPPLLLLLLPPLLPHCCHRRRRTSKKRRKQRQLRQRGGAPEGSSVLFRWLFRTCVAWLLWEWVRVSACWGAGAAAGRADGGVAQLMERESPFRPFATSCCWSPSMPSQDSWSATVQLVLLVFTALVVLGLVPLVLLTTNRLSSAMFSPVKTPTASAPQVGLEQVGLAQ